MRSWKGMLATDASNGCSAELLDCRAFAKRCEKLYAGKHADKAEAQGEPAKGNDAAASQTRSLKGGRGGLTEDAALTLR
eukprot:738335-Prorocentrum_lima.AAC.1